MSKLLLKIHDVKKQYRENNKITRCFKGVSLEIFEGEILGLLGVNGAGKTTLSSIIATLHPPTSGDIKFNGRSIYDQLIDYRNILGFCPQRPNLNPQLTIDETLTFAGKIFNLSDAKIKERKSMLIEKFSLQQYVHSKADVLSGGYKQRFLIARALMHSPKLVILDEPTVGLDPHIRRNLWELIKDLKKDGVTVILTTHYLDEAEILADRVCILDKGLVRLIDTPANLKSAHQKGNLEDVFLKLMEDVE